MVALVVLPLYVSTLLERIEQARAKAEEANKAKTTFLANMSHEMRTPLNGVVGAIELFRTTNLDARQSELMRLLQHSVGILRGLVDDVLDISKIEAGRLTIEIADFDLHGVMNSIISLLRPHAKNKGLALSALVDPGIDYRLRGDSHHLAQVLLNLVSNAIKFTERGSVELSVTLKSLTSHGVALRFEVRDTGIGIPKEAQARIFERFVQADDSTTRRYGGTGLGTTIAKQLVELMGGSIGLTSTVGVGSTFWLEVPLLFAEASTGPSSQGLALIVASEGEQARVLKMVGAAFRDFRLVSELAIDDSLQALHREGQTVSALFFCGDMVKANRLFTRLSGDSRNGATALVYVASANNFANAATQLLQIEGVSVVDSNAPPVHLHNAVHAATSKGGPLGQVIELRTILEEQRQSLNILVAEDNATNQEIVKQLLEKAGHRVLLADDGEAALDLYEASQPDVAILDFNMPERNGLEVTKAIRAMEPTNIRLPIMILSASVTADARERARRAGADEFIGKPYDAGSLLQTIDRMARRARNAEWSSSQQTTAVERTGDIHDLRVVATPLLDEKRLDELRGIAGDSQFLSRLVLGFSNDLTRLLQSLTDVLNASELARVSDITHAIKGAALGIGAARLAAFCLELEKHALDGRRDAALATLVRLQRCFDETSVSLQMHITQTAKVVSS
jgi:two-component system sensor histidine kinase RpfC